MKYILSFLFVFISFVSFSQSDKDSTAIVQLLKDDYKTMVSWDVEKHKSNCTANYLLIENGEIWTLEMEADDYRKKSHRVLTRVDSFDFKSIRIYGNTAYAVYGLRSDITENGKLTIKHWIESTIFRKEDGKWKIELIHSTPVAISK